MITWSKEDSEEDEKVNRSEVNVTSSVVKSMMNTLVPGIKFTTETEEDFEGWLPTLDVQVKMEDQPRRKSVAKEKRVIRYKFFSKTMSNVKVAEFGTAHPINSIYATLSQEVNRRLLRCDLETKEEVLRDVLEEFSTKLVTSKFGKVMVAKIIRNGME